MVDGSYPTVIDVESFAYWILAHDIMGTKDGGGVNLYFVKYDRTPESLMTTGPLWDFDSAELRDDLWSSVHEQRFSKFFKNVNPQFLYTYKKLWEENGDKIFMGIQEWINALTSDSWEAYNKSVKADHDKWGDSSYEDTKEIQDRMNSWYPIRREWLATNIPNLTSGNGIDLISIEDTMPFSLCGTVLTLCPSDRNFSVNSSVGQLIYSGTPISDTPLHLPGAGVYVITCGSRAWKVIAN